MQYPMSLSRFQVLEYTNVMALQVEILQLENNLAQARQRLGEMRKISYQEE